MRTAQTAVAILLAVLPSTHRAAPGMAQETAHAQRLGRTLRLVVSAGYDAGTASAVEAPMLDGRSRPLEIDGGWAIALGAAVPFGEQPGLEVQGTVGWKGASEGDASFREVHLSFPVELLAAWQWTRLRVAAGPTLHLNPIYKGNGVASGADAYRQNALGAVAQVEYLTGDLRSPVRGGVAARIGWVSERPLAGGPSRSGTTFGLRLGVYL
jgi:hypothetical protein